MFRGLHKLATHKEKGLIKKFDMTACASFNIEYWQEKIGGGLGLWIKPRNTYITGRLTPMRMDWKYVLGGAGDAARFILFLQSPNHEFSLWHWEKSIANSPTTRRVLFQIIIYGIFKAYYLIIYIPVVLIFDNLYSTCSLYFVPIREHSMISEA